MIASSVESGGSNILLPEGAEHARVYCEVCDTVCFWRDHFMICPSCGWKVREDELMPKTSLSAKWQGNDMLVQPEKETTHSDLPDGASLISDDDVL